MYEVKSDCQIPNLKTILLDNIGFKNDGIFVEIGAYDGESISNTVFLADIGWNGIYVEPVKEYYEKCLIRHKDNTNVKVFNYLIGDKEEEKIIYKGGDISTSNKEIVDFFNSNSLPWARGRHTGEFENIQQITLEKIFVDNNLKNVDLMTIDTEGNEWEIIKNFNFDKYNIKLIIVEMHETSDAWKTCPNLLQDNKKINEKMFLSGYKKIFVDDINTIFVKT